MSKTSHRVDNSGRKHPLHDAVKVFANGKLPEIHAQIHAAAKAMGKTTPSYINANIVDFAKKNGQYDEIRKMVCSFLAKEKEAKTRALVESVRPPRSTELYGRVAGGVIKDVGTGNGKRLVRFKERFASVEMIDPYVEDKVEGIPDFWPRVERFQACEEVVTSFNSATVVDNKTWEAMEQSDGLHVVPHVAAFVEKGLSVPVDGIFKTTIDGKVFNDVDRQVGDFQKLGDFYRGYVTYAERSILFRPTCKFKTNGVTRSPFVRMTTFVGGKMSYKYDGTFVRLENRDGKFRMWDRVGRGVAGISDFKEDIVLEMEKMPECFRLLRVVRYRNYEPFHSVAALRKFVERKHPMVGNVVVLPPEELNVIPPEPGEHYDGIVCRSGGVDYVANYGISLDLHPGQKDELECFLREEKCMAEILHYGLGEDAIYSVSVRLKTGGEALCFWKIRVDKTKFDARHSWKSKFKCLTVENILEQLEDNEDCNEGFLMDPAEGESSDEEM